MRYIGNKEKLANWIYHEITSRGITGDVFFDFFAGTASVGKYFKKKGFQIVSSDLLYCSYILQKAYIENNEQPLFSKLLKHIDTDESQMFPNQLVSILEYLNNILPHEGFIYKNYTPSGTADLKQPRMFFSDDNGRKIDAIRMQIESWKNESLLLENEYYILLACLIESISFFANVAGIYAAFHKKWDPRAIKPFKLRPINCIVSTSTHHVYNDNSLELLNKQKYDIIYIDPPYNQRQYAPNYHLPETIAKYDNPQINGVAGIRNYAHQKSGFCNKETALKELELILCSENYQHIVLSYSSEGIMPAEMIIRLMEKYGTLEIADNDYLRFKSNNNGLSETKKYIKEQLYILTKK